MSVNPNTQAEATDRVVYEEFEPPYDWDHDDASDTLILMVPGFRKDQLKVQVTSNQVLRLSGERKISENKWRQFKKEIKVPNSDTKAITAKFEAGILYIRLPKLPTPVKPQQPITTDQSQPKKAEKEEEPPKQEEPQKKENGKKETGPPIDQQGPKEKEVAEPKSEAQTTLDSNKENGKKEKIEAQAHVQAVDQKSPKVEKGVESKSEEQTGPHVDKQSPKLKEAEKPKSEAQTKLDSQKKEKDAVTSKSDYGKMEKRSSTMEMLSRQNKEYKSGLSSFVEEVKKQRKLANLVLLTFFVLLFGLYLKNVVKSSFGGSKSHEL